jgi:hypothetical protein
MDESSGCSTFIPMFGVAIFLILKVGKLASFPFTVTITWDSQLRKNKGLFWLTILEISVQGWLTLLLLGL